MLKEALAILEPGRGKSFVDATLGAGGYTFRLAEMIKPDGIVIAIDLDRRAIEHGRRIIGQNNGLYNNVILANDNFKNLTAVIDDNWPPAKEKKIDGIVLDLGMSSAQLNDKTRGFSFQADAPLDMAFGRSAKDTDGISTAAVINSWPIEKIALIIKDFGEEKFYRKIAGAIGKTRKTGTIATTAELVEIISRAVPPSYRHDRRLHFATRTFQALRIATNRELDNLLSVLPLAVKALTPGGKLVIISYHSLEDRIVKNFLRAESRGCICPPSFPVCNCGHQATLKIITKRPLPPTPAETDANPRARSAKLRAAIKI